MRILNKIKKEIWKTDQELKEKDKSDIVNAVLRKLELGNFTHTDQSEILNRIILRVWETKKEKRKQLITEARELQQSMVEMPLKKED